MHEEDALGRVGPRDERGAEAEEEVRADDHARSRRDRGGPRRARKPIDLAGAGPLRAAAPIRGSLLAAQYHEDAGGQDEGAAGHRPPRDALAQQDEGEDRRGHRREEAEDRAVLHRAPGACPPPTACRRPP